PVVVGRDIQLSSISRQVAFTWESLVALRIEGFLPLAEQVVGDAEVACGLGEAASLLGDKFDSFDLELAGENTPGFAHKRPPHKELTLFSERSPSVGKSRDFHKSLSFGPGSTEMRTQGRA